MQGGRPREHDREKIAKDLIEWAKLDDSINVNKFCALHCDPPIPVNDLNTWASQDESFRRSYEIAKSFLAFRREEFVSSDLLHVKAYDLNSAAYDRYLNSHKREEAKFQSELNKEEAKAYSEKDSEKLDSFLNQLSSMQSDRKMATSNAVSENKS